MSKSNIEWTDNTPNPIVGCTKESAGCADCYAIRMAWRLMHSPHAAVAEKYAGTVEKTAGGNLNWTGKINYDDKAMGKVIADKKPRLHFVNSMGDLFHPNVEFAEIDKVFAAFYVASWHTFQVLTKHPDVALDYFNDANRKLEVYRHGYEWGGFGVFEKSITWPLPNVWIGTSIEDQKAADKRRPHLKAIKEMGWTVFVSNEPAIGPVNWQGFEFIDQLITGGESGSKARPMHPQWARDARDFCHKHGIPFFFKQWGEWLPFEEMVQFPFWLRCNDHEEYDAHGMNMIDPETSEAGRWMGHPWYDSMDSIQISIDQGGPQVNWLRVGKHDAGRMLDGKTYSEFPKQYLKLTNG